MHDSTSAGLQRPRVRRGLGVLVGAALLVTPLAAAPAASAQGLNNVTRPGSVAAFVAGLLERLPIIVQGLPSPTLAHPLGEKAPNAVPTCGADYADGLGSTLTCIVAALEGGGTQAKAKATTRRGKVRSVRWVGR